MYIYICIYIYICMNVCIYIYRYDRYTYRKTPEFIDRLIEILIDR